MAFIFTNPRLAKKIEARVREACEICEVWENGLQVRDVDWEIVVSIVNSLPGPVNIWGVPPGAFAAEKLREIPDDCPDD